MKHMKNNMLIFGRRFFDFIYIIIIATLFFSLTGCGDGQTSGHLNKWHLRNPLPQGSSLSGVTYGNGTFVAVGDTGTILTSSDGVTWTTRTSGTTNYLDGVTYGNGTFVAVGDTGTILTSSDGVTWTARTSGTSNYLAGVTYGNGTFVVVGAISILTSPDGVTWTARTSGEIFYYFAGVTYGNGTFVAVGGINNPHITGWGDMDSTNHMDSRDW